MASAPENRSAPHRPPLPVVTWTLVALNVIIFLWDRGGWPFGPNLAFADLAMRPADIAAGIRGEGDRFPLVTLLTSLFLHGSLMHLLSNMFFLVVFGQAIEEALGSVRFTLYYLAWGFAAAAVQIYVNPESVVSVLGASGAIGGILGAYLLIFPANRFEIQFPFFSKLDFDLSAWVLLVGWFLYQVFVPQEGVASWAHVGGFLAGMLTVLIAGGRSMILAGRDPELDFT